MIRRLSSALCATLLLFALGAGTVLHQYADRAATTERHPEAHAGAQVRRVDIRRRAIVEQRPEWCVDRDGKDSAQTSVPWRPDRLSTVAVDKSVDPLRAAHPSAGCDSAFQDLLTSCSLVEEAIRIS